MNELFHLDLELGGGTTQEKIIVHQGQKLETVASQYCSKKGLNQVIESIILEQLKDKAKSLYRSANPYSSQPTSNKPPIKTPQSENRHLSNRSRNNSPIQSAWRSSQTPFNKSRHDGIPEGKFPTDPGIQQKKVSNTASPIKQIKNSQRTGDRLFFPVSKPNVDNEKTPSPKRTRKTPEPHPRPVRLPQKHENPNIFLIEDSFVRQPEQPIIPVNQAPNEAAILEKKLMQIEKMKKSIEVGERLYATGLRQLNKRHREQSARMEAEALCASRDRSIPRIDEISKQIVLHKYQDDQVASTDVFTRLVSDGERWQNLKDDLIGKKEQLIGDRNHYKPKVSDISQKLVSAIREKTVSATKNKSAFDRLFDNNKMDYYSERKYEDKENDHKNKRSKGDYKTFLKRMDDDLALRIQNKNPAPVKKVSDSKEREKSKEARETTNQLYNSAFELKEKKKQAEEQRLKEIKDLASKPKITKKSEEIIEAIIKHRIAVMFQGFDIDKNGLISFTNVKAQFEGDPLLPTKFKELIGPFVNFIVQKKMTLDSMAFEYSLRKFVLKLTIEEKRFVLGLDTEGKTAFMNIAKKQLENNGQQHQVEEDVEPDKSFARGVSLIFDELPKTDPWNTDLPEVAKMKKNMDALDEISVAAESINMMKKRKSKRPRADPTTLSRLVSDDSSFASKMRSPT